MGMLNNLRSFLWISVQQYTTREVQVDLFRHLHSLSLRWHLGRKTGEVLTVMDRGTDSINNLLNYILFSIAPTLIDIFVAVVFFISIFNIWFGVIVFVTMGLYICKLCSYLRLIEYSEFLYTFQWRQSLWLNGAPSSIGWWTWQIMLRRLAVWTLSSTLRLSSIMELRITRWTLTRMPLSHTRCVTYFAWVGNVCW